MGVKPSKEMCGEMRKEIGGEASEEMDAKTFDFVLQYGCYNPNNTFQLVMIRRNDVQQPSLWSERCVWLLLQPDPQILHFKSMCRRAGTCTFKKGRLTIRDGGEKATFLPVGSSRAQLLTKIQWLSASQEEIIQKLLKSHDKMTAP